MNRTRASHLIPSGLAGDEAEQVKDISQSYPGTDFAEVNPRHSGAPENQDISLSIGACILMRLGRDEGDREEEPVILLVDMII
jgi:hypothetical protein